MFRLLARRPKWRKQRTWHVAFALPGWPWQTMEVEVIWNWGTGLRFYTWLTSILAFLMISWWCCLPTMLHVYCHVKQTSSYRTDCTHGSNLRSWRPNRFTRQSLLVSFVVLCPQRPRTSKDNRCRCNRQCDGTHNDHLNRHSNRSDWQKKGLSKNGYGVTVANEGL